VFVWQRTFTEQGISKNQPSINLTHVQTRRATIVSPDAQAAFPNYEEYVNPQWVSLLNLLGMNVEYERCLGSELFTKDGRRILDFMSGYCVYHVGHNHPYIIQALKDEMDKCGPAMLQSHVPEIAGELARRLCNLAGGGLDKVYFGSSGSEGVEAAIKFARASTGRDGIVYAKSSFHGLTAGALRAAVSQCPGPRLDGDSGHENNRICQRERSILHGQQPLSGSSTHSRADT
jgi:4-aminobutyrate aminotransferase-like enzyme